jgi:Mg2+ and Co2+ transporter CorA
MIPNVDYSKAILVVDPSVKEGFPLWSGYRSFYPAPSMKADIVGLPPRDSAFEEMIYWVMEIIAESPTNIHTHPKYLVLPILTIIAAEWLTLLQYCTTRMNQVELDLQNPNFTNPLLGLESSLRRIYHWRRALPIYLKWVNEILRNILSDKMLTTNGPAHPPLLKLRDDFLIIKQDLEAIQTQVQNQIMNMVSTVGAITSLQESQRAVEQNRNITRLTYLAAVFVPMSFVSSFLSMTPNVRELAETFKLYFILSLPLTFMALSVVQWAYLKRWILAGINRSEGSK